MAGIWTEAKDAFRRIRREEKFPGRSEAWHRQTARIALLEEAVGQALDALGATFSDARKVAYGRSRLQQRRRLDVLRESLAQRHQPRPLRTKVAEQGGQQLRLRLALEVPDHLSKKSNKQLRALAITGLLPALKRLGFRLVIEEPRERPR